MKKIVLLYILLISFFTYSQAPQGINYQSIALDSSNQPINSQSIGLRISILNLTSTGTTLYSEKHTPTTNSQGLYSIIIGQGTILSGTFSTIPWGTGNKFLKVELDPNGGAAYSATGVSQFFSVPYSLHSISATNATTATTSTNSEMSISVSNISTLKQMSIDDVNDGDVVTLRGYYSDNDGGGGRFFWNETDTTEENNGTIIKPNSVTSNGRWNRIIENNSVSVKWFGAKADCNYYACFNDVLGTATDNRECFQNAINFCMKKGYELVIPSGEQYDYSPGAGCNGFSPSKKYYQYKINGTLIINNPIKIIASPNSGIVSEMSDNGTQPTFQISNCARGLIKDLSITGYQYKPKAGIVFNAPDNQAMELDNVKIITCFYGIFSETSNYAVNRMVFNRCDFSSNIRAGVYIKCGEPTAPIHFVNTIMNANGWQSWMQSITPNIGSYQLYTSGVYNISYIAGQISNHGESEINSLVYLEKGAGANFQGVDIEGDVQINGKGKNFYTAAFWVKNFQGFNIMQSHIWQINAPTVFLFDAYCENVNIQGIELDNVKNKNFGNFTYSVNVIYSNFYDDPAVSYPGPGPENPNYPDPNFPITNNTTTTFLTYDGPTHKLSESALDALDKSSMEILTNINGPILKNAKLESIFTTKPSNTTNYLITTSSDTTLSIEKNVSNLSVIYVLLECTQYTFDPIGSFFIKEYNSSNVQTSYVTKSLKGKHLINGKFYTSIKVNIDNGTRKIKYGFVNTGASCSTCNIPTHATVNGFTVYADYRNPISKRQRMNTDY